MRYRTILPGLWAPLVGLALGLLASTAAPAQSGSGASPAQAALDTANKAIQKGDFKLAIAELKKAAKQDPSCFNCHYWLARALNRTRDYAGAAEAGRKAADKAGNAADRAAAWNQVGTAEYAGGQADAKGMKAAEDAYRKALEADPADAVKARFSLGVVLLEQERDAEGVAQLEEFLKTNPAEAEAAEARQLIADPARARVDLMADFAAPILGGETWKAADHRGRVVVFVFWASYHPPSYASIPFAKGLAKRAVKEKLSVVSVSSDGDDKAWRKFIKDNGMNWPQVWDRDQAISAHFGVAGLPTFIIFDGKGKITQVTTGWYETDTAVELATGITEALETLK